MNTGPDLDRAVANAMGWKPPHERGRCDVCGWPLVTAPESGCVADNCSMRPHPTPRADHIAPYSTEFGPHTQEMLTWLEARAYTIDVWWSDKRDFRIPASASWGASCTFNEGKVDVDQAEKVPEVISHLVVAVAERERKEGK